MTTQQEEDRNFIEQFRLLAVVYSFNASYPTDRDLDKDPKLKAQLEPRFRKFDMEVYTGHSARLIEQSLETRMKQEGLISDSDENAVGKKMAALVEANGLNSAPVKGFARELLTEMLPRAKGLLLAILPEEKDRDLDDIVTALCERSPAFPPSQGGEEIFPVPENGTGCFVAFACAVKEVISMQESPSPA